MSDEGASIQGKLLKIVEELQQKVQVNENRMEVETLARKRSNEKEKVTDRKIVILKKESSGYKSALDMRETALRVEEIMIQDLTSPIRDLSGESVKTINEARKVKTVQQFAKFADDHKHCICKDGLPPGVDIQSLVLPTISRKQSMMVTWLRTEDALSTEVTEYSVKTKPVLYICLHTTIFHSPISSRI